MGKSKKLNELSKERILNTALELTDQIGIESFTLRRLAAALDAGPMSIYHYFHSKEEIIDGMVEAVFEEILLPPENLEWKDAAKIRCLSAREVLCKHPWAPPLMESRRYPGPANLKHHDSMIGCFRRGGLSMELTSQAVAVVDAFLYGFALQEASLPGGGGEEMLEMGAEMYQQVFKPYPHLSDLTDYVLHSEYRFPSIFEKGLDLILEGFTAKKDSFQD